MKFTEILRRARHLSRPLLSGSVRGRNPDRPYRRGLERSEHQLFRREPRLREIETQPREIQSRPDLKIGHGRVGGLRFEVSQRRGGRLHDFGERTYEIFVLFPNRGRLPRYERRDGYLKLSHQSERLGRRPDKESDFERHVSFGGRIRRIGLGNPGDSDKLSGDIPGKFTVSERKLPHRSGLIFGPGRSVYGVLRHGD